MKIPPLAFSKKMKKENAVFYLAFSERK